ncbi:uncharacterized protein LOC117330077 [Pecten maximus]|uniref:uncharacterized protein LOC117330077 n=1 Tax=Pecten maximus TaxID=6579 RepID=UPI0014586931|nr:uncharacterized protein LOC117330077 [Pecten maximus]
MASMYQEQNKDKLKEGFEYLENVIHRDFKQPPWKLIQERKQYAKGRDLILSTATGSNSPNTGELRKDSKVHEAKKPAGTRTPSNKKGQDTTTAQMSPVNHVEMPKPEVSKEKNVTKKASGTPRQSYSNGNPDKAGQKRHKKNDHVIHDSSRETNDLPANHYQSKPEVSKEKNVTKKASGTPRQSYSNGNPDKAGQKRHKTNDHVIHDSSRETNDLPVNHYQDEAQVQALRSNTSRGMYKDDEREDARLQRKFENMERELKDTEAKLHQAEQEKEYWVNRMSKVTGDKLTRDNPDVADLSDPNRPQKLGEQYSQLYDDEWTDAMEILTDTDNTKDNERRGIDFLISILKRSHETCIKHADDQMKQLQEVVMLEPSVEQTGDTNYPIEVQRSLKDAQKQASKRSLPVIREKVKHNLKSLEENNSLDMLGPFVDKITEICWGMVMQSPRVEFLFPPNKRGERFNKDFFKEFTQSGDSLDYVVWPAMVTHKQGSLLMKGIVQPISRQ